MENLPIITNILLIVFVLFYISVFTFTRQKFSKKNVYKSSLKKSQVDLWSMEAQAFFLERDRKEKQELVKQKERQIEELAELKKEKEAELEELKAKKNEANWEEIKEKKQEIIDIDGQIGGSEQVKEGTQMSGMTGEIAKINADINWVERTFGELQKQMTLKQRAIDSDRELLKKI